MLKDIEKHRPDRQLERNLIFLSYVVMFMSLSLFSLFVYPQFSLYIIGATVLLNILCILVTMKIMKVSESTIGFGNLASEILNVKDKYHIINDSQGKIILANKLALEYFEGNGIVDFFEKNIIDTNANRLDMQKLHSALSKYQPTTVEVSINPRKNSIYISEEWMRISVKPISINKTDIFEDKYSLQHIQKDMYLFWTIENITSNKNMEQVFQDEMTALHNFIDFLSVGLYTCSTTGYIEYINDTLANFLGIDKISCLGKKIDEFISYKAEQVHTRNGVFNGRIVFKTASENKEAFVKQQNIKENNEIKSRGIVIFDLPNDQMLHEQLNSYVDKFSWVFDSAPIGIVFVDKQLNILEANQYIKRIFNNNQIVEGKKFNLLFNAEAKEKINKAIDDFSTNNTKEFRFESIINNETEDKNVYVVICPTKLHYSSELGEKKEGMVFYISDITNERNLEMQIGQAQKMQAFGQLAGGVAHDFNNLLTAVIGYSDLLIQRHGIGDPSFSDLVQLKQNANRAAGVARQLLAISRQQPLNPKLIDVTEAFLDIDRLLARALGEQIKLQINYTSDLGYIRVDPVQFSQVMLNLVINAKDAMNNKGSLTISTHIEHLNEEYKFGTDVIKPGDFVVISVTDTGCGIPTENLNRIFEPFFSTKKNVVGSGTGLGLAMVYGIVRQTEGFIKVHSEVGKGTTFEIYLPSYESNEEVIQNEEEKSDILVDKKGNIALETSPMAPMNLPDNNKLILGMNVASFDSKRKSLHDFSEKRILFVEDEDAVRTVGVRGLRRKGFEVVDCVSGENALEHLNNGEKFDMLITDMMMPGMSGAELSKVALSQQPNMLVILASGYSEEIARDELASSPNFEFIGKPYSLGKLYEVITKVFQNATK